ncbi:hypothetical protein LEN26_008234 [Aphanomyces euteiches]|nr:hypothetical protein AeMF1_016341 [Aphanomyces euteiches]KAH9130754.1 hypothetical protein LEN26_008234 [Aphanomyces euteiches]KAH9188504.1 hypothetical protein AeNC1_009527 [Aphanomyces euteiches]
MDMAGWSKTTFFKMLSMSAIPSMPLASAFPPAAALEKPVFVFGWNNFLCPMTWLQQTMAVHPNQLQHPNLRQSLDAIDACIANVLNQAKTMASAVFVVYDDSMTLLEQLCSSFFPRCAALFRAREVLLVPNRPDVMASIYSNNLVPAMSTLFQRPIHFAVFGLDALRESCANMPAHALALYKLVCSAKSQPNLEQIFHQLQLLGQGLLAVVASHPSSMNMSL